MIKTEVNTYWENIWKETEETRFSEDSAIAYNDLKDILKYHLFEKRDGGIINKIITEDGTIIYIPKEVNEELAKTIEEIQVDNNWAFLERKPFPKLSPLKPNQIKNMLSSLSTHKAITLDGLSDIMFDRENIKRIIMIFRDLWSIDLDDIPGIDCSFISRLIPLNKVFPNTPTRTQMRPILICSPLQKALESRFLSKLNEYLIKKLTPCQTGFIPNMGIQVNLTRAIYNIKETMKIKRNTYGLFIDFANAYNTVPHELLFKKLREKKCMNEDEIDYLEALYSRYRIRIGNRTIKFNKGVAQGSILSPALFNIFIEDLVEELSKETGLSVQQILLYADDILLLCQTVPQLKKCINIIENWSEKNGMKLNKKKSGIVVFSPRNDKTIPYM